MKKQILWTTIILVCFALTACFAGCKKKPADTKTDKKAIAGKKAGKKAGKDFNPYPLDGVKAALKKQGYDPKNLMEFDGNLYYAYEVDTADEYDTQFEVALGQLLGLLGGYTRETVMQFTAKKSDLIDFAAGKLKPGELFLKLKIEAVKTKK